MNGVDSAAVVMQGDKIGEAQNSGSRLFKTKLYCLFIWVLQFFYAANQDTKSPEGTVNESEMVGS